MTTKESVAFHQGYCLAVATLIRQHGSDTEALDLLKVVVNSVDWSTIDEFDMEVLRPVLEDLRRRRINPETSGVCLDRKGPRRTYGERENKIRGTGA